MLRRSAIGLALAAAGAPLALRAQPAGMPLKIGAITVEAAAETFFGTEMGFFKKHGLDVESTIMNNGSAIASAVVAGALDIGFCDTVTVAAAHARDVPFLYLAPAEITSYDAPALAVLVRGDGPIHGPADMNGKTFAVNALNNITHLPLKGWIDRNGGDSKTMKWVEIPVPAVTEAIAKGTVDGGIVGEPFITIGTSQGERALFMDKNAIAPRYLLSGFMSARAWIDRNHDVAARFIAAMREIADWANTNQAASTTLLTKFANAPEALMRRIRRGQFAVQLQASDVQPVIEAAVKYGVIAKSFPATEIFYAPR